MGRKMEYFCDACGKTFGNESHLNIKQGRLYISYYGKSLEIPKAGVDIDTWRQQEVKLGNNELHFCNIDCMMLYIVNKVRVIQEKLKGE